MDSDKSVETEERRKTIVRGAVAFKVPRATLPSHISSKHIGKTVEEIADRIITEGPKVVSSFPSKANAGLAARNFPIRATPIRSPCTLTADSYVGWGLRAHANLSKAQIKSGMKASSFFHMYIIDSKWIHSF